MDKFTVNPKPQYRSFFCFVFFVVVVGNQDVQNHDMIMNHAFVSCMINFGFVMCTVQLI